MKIRLLLAFLALARAQNSKVFNVEEGAPVGTYIGLIGSAGPYLIVPLDNQDNPEKDLIINQNNGDIRTKTILDREVQDKYLFSAIPLNGESIQVQINVQDINDNAPTFKQKDFKIDIPENIPKGTKRKLPSAVDPDEDGVQHYDIVSGNVGEAFDLQFNKERDTLDLVVKGSLDREKLEKYSMILLASDNGQPPKSASMTLTVQVQDLNDSPPIFSKQRYFTTVSENLPIGSSVLQVSASDADEGSNARIIYSINRKQSDQNELFEIDSNNGLLSVNKNLNFERQKAHEIVVVARDGGEVPQETSAFITVRLTSSSSNGFPSAPSAVSKNSNSNFGGQQSLLKVVYFDGEELSEFVPVNQPFGYLIGINGFNLNPNDRVELIQGNEIFKIIQESDKFKLATKKKLDFEVQSAYRLKIKLTKSNGKIVETNVHVDVTDGNEHEPKFEQSSYIVSLSESSSIGSSVMTVKASDLDNGKSGQISYSFRYSDSSSSTFSDWFSIDESTGLITTQSKLDCELENNPRVIIVASDHGSPIKTATATFSASISDVNDHRPIFSQTLYDLEVKEDTPKGKCVVTVQATDNDCGDSLKYSFTEPTDFFQVDQNTGELCIIKQLDYEKQPTHNLIVQAEDQGGLSSSILINIAVGDINDNIPEFLPTVYMAKVVRNLAQNVPILTVKATDKDDNGKGQLKYTIKNGNENKIFTLGTTSGTLYLAKSLKSDVSRKSYSLTIEAFDKDGQKSVNQASVVIQVIDSVEIPFNSYQFEFKVPEDVSPYSEIGVIRPKSSNNIFKYTLMEQSVLGYFSLDSNTGSIRSEARLDHESHPQVILNILAESRSGENYYIQAIIKINDVNDNAPEFPFSSLFISVPEDFPISEVVYTILASDADSNTNGQVIYKIINGGPGDTAKFSIDKTTGQIRLRSSLDFENKANHRLIIEAEDLGRPKLKSQLKLDISVQDVNDNAPVFDKPNYSFPLAESHVQGTPVLTIHAEDKDSGKNGRLTYSISPNPYINILPNSGVLVLNSPLKKEINPLLDLIVTVVDNGVPSRKASTKVKMIVSDKNDFTPSFNRQKYVFNTVENLPVGTRVGTVKADDNDEGLNGQVQYRFRTPISKFEIGSSTGDIKTLENLDREESDTYELLVEAIDQGTPARSSQTLVKILVDDINDQAPLLLAPANKMLYAPRTTNSLTIGTIIATDEDKNDAITYELLRKNDVVTLDKWTGELKLKHEQGSISTAANTTISVKISDSARPTPNFIVKDFSIFFIDQAANELLSSISYDITVNQDTPIGSIIGSLKTFVPSKRSEYLFAFEQTARIQELPVYLNAITGELFLIAPLRRDISSVGAKIESKIGDTIPLNVLINFKMADTSNGNRPTFEQDPIFVEVEEKVRVGSTVHHVKPKESKQKPNDDQLLLFAILEQLPNNAFVIEDNTGKIKLAKQLDFEKEQNYILTVRVTETRSQLSTFVTVVVSVKDTNDNQPLILSGDELELSTDVILNVPVTKIVALDKDSGKNGELEYAFISGNDDDVFEINAKTGDILVKKPPFRDYYLRIRVSDLGTPQLFSDKELHVKVNTGQSGHLKFIQSTINLDIEENLPAGTTLSALEALNNNRGGSRRLNYQLLVGNDKFSMDSSTGQLKTQSSLDREEQDTYSLVVSVADQQYPEQSDTAIVNVNVVDVNDNDPIFGASCKDLNIPENSDQEYIHTLLASDRDSGENGRLTYRFENSDHFPFKLDPDSGRLSAPPLDRETKKKYRLSIIAQDHGLNQIRRSASCSITVTILDENDNEPSFSQTIYSASLKEDVAIGTEVLRVLASDPDEGDNAAIEYSIENATFSVFTIDKNSGAIYTTDYLDRENIDEYKFNVQAVDGGKGMVKSSRAIVNVIITDANDHTPQFDEFPFMINMTATPPIGVPLLRLSASDPDLGAHSQLTYNLVRPEQRALFELSASEGILTIQNGDVSWEPGTIQTLEVTVSDAGRPPKSSTGLVEVFIEGGPAVSLAFQQQTYHAEVAENPISGEDITKVHAVRSDGRRQPVIYTFLRGNEASAFEINSNNGIIRVRDPEVIDYEKNKQFVLTIQGQGLGVEDDLNAFTTCIIKVKNVNDNVPKFTQNMYIARVLEGLPKASLVTTVTAFDLDYEQSNDDITYEIIGGNVDEAFYMTTAQPGVILTNTVLDREIRDSYELTVAAKDNGQPTSLTGTCKVSINILDANDSPLQFPAFPPFRVSQDQLAGTLIATVRANDIDLNSNVVYLLKDGPYADRVTLMTYTGQIFLKTPPSLWNDNENEIEILVEAFDGVFRTERNIKIFYDESKDCQPKFDSPLYQFQLSFNATFPTQVGDLTATSCGSGNENLIFSLISSGPASVFPSNGTMIVNQPLISNSTKFIVQVQDRRSREASKAVVIVKSTDHVDEPLEFDLNSETIEVGSATKVTQLKLKNEPTSGAKPMIFQITPNPYLAIDPVSGVIYKIGGHLDSKTSESLEVSVRRINEATTVTKSLRFFMSSPQYLPDYTKVITSTKTVTLPLSSPVNSKVPICEIPSEDQPIISQILSGNDDNLFNTDSSKHSLVLIKTPLKPMTTNVVLRIGRTTNDLTICKVQVTFTQDHKLSGYYNFALQNLEIFPIKDFVVAVEENSPKGTLVLELPTSLPKQKLAFSTNSNLFSVHPKTGVITTNQVLDYESERVHLLQVFVQNNPRENGNQNSNQQQACNIQVMVESQDEFAPVFTQDIYTFDIPPNGSPGYILGNVKAEDVDSGPDGYVTYTINPSNSYFHIDHRTGAISLRRQLDTGVLNHNNNLIRRRRRSLKGSLKELQLLVQAKSLKADSKISSTKVVMYVEENLLPVAASTEDGGVTPWIQGVLVALFLILICLGMGAVWHCKRRRDLKQAQKIALLPTNPHAQGHTLGNTSSTYSGDQSLEMVGSVMQGSRYPPQYSEIMSDYGGTATTVSHSANTKHHALQPRSELSEKSHRSASSGRGSVEEGDEDADVEIRMINEGNWNLPSNSNPTGAGGSTASGSHHHYEGTEDQMSQSSAQNTEEYLARLGIDIRKPPNVKLPVPMEDPYSASTAGGSIYNRIPEDAMSEHNSTISAKPHSLLYGSTGRPLSMTGSLSSIIHSEEELTGSYNWDYLLDWCPQYQNLAHVFKEISKLKDDDTSGSASAVARTSHFTIKNHPTIGNRLVPVRASQSPIAQDMLSQNALSPSFHPSLSPLATKSPSVSPMSVPLRRDLGPPKMGRGPIQ